MSPATYTPKHLAEKILTSKAALEGERKQVTVLFADLKGSMELLADRDPEEARRLLQSVVERMMEAVHRYEGTVNQVMGDGIMALFGAPLAHEDHAVRACYAALRMQDGVRHYSDELRRAQGVEVQIRIGVNSGEVVVGSIGSDLRMDYTAVGQTTHLAARMEQLAAPGSIRLTAETLRLAEGFVQVTPLGPVPVKGLAEPVAVFELVGAGAARTRLEAAAPRGFTRFVGRDAELEQLRDALARAGRGHGQVVGVVGEPGVGKSRIFWEFTHSHRISFEKGGTPWGAPPSRSPGGWLIVKSASVSYGKATVYLPVIELLRGYFEIESREDPRKIREKVTGKLLALDRALEPTLPALLALLDVPADEPSWHALDPPQRRQRTLDAVKRLLLRESEVQPLMVVFEDLHWIDGETQALLDGLVDSLPAARLLLLVNYRSEYQHAWGGKTYYRQLRIDPLAPESADELLDSLLGLDVALGPLKQLLVERTEANPLFLEESVQALVETAALAGERGAYRLTRPVEELTIPATVQAILAARIDRLAPEAKRLLHAAAVIGKDVPMPLLLAIADAPEPAVRAELTHLQAAEFLYETRLFPDLEYTFKHALTHDVAYGGLLHDRRRALHARITEAIERLAPERVADQAERLAHHALRGELWEQAVTYLRQAGTRALARSAYREATAHFEQALVSLRRLPEDRRTHEQAIDLRLDLRNALHLLGEFGQALGHLRAAERLAKILADEHRLGWISAFMTVYGWWTGDHENALESGQRALAIGAATGDFALQIAANLYLGPTYHALGDYRHAIDVLRRNRESLTGDYLSQRLGNPFLPSVLSRAWLLYCLVEVGAFSEGTAIGEEARRVAEEVDDAFSLGAAYYGIGLLALRRGEFPIAISWLEQGLALCREKHVPLSFPWVAAALGMAYARIGRGTEAFSLLEQVVAQAAAMQLIPWRALWIAELGEICLLAARMEEASAHAHDALAIARVHKERGHEAYALRLLGEIALRVDPPEPDQAAAHVQHALALADELGMRPLAAHCRLDLGKLYRRTRERERARDHLATARTMYREMGMRFWMGQAEAELRQCNDSATGRPGA